jgi:hypothetical protein
MPKRIRPSYDHVRALTVAVEAARNLSDDQVTALHRALDAAGASYDHGGRPNLTPAQRAFLAAAASSRWSTWRDLVQEDPIAALEPRLAALVRDLIDPADYAALNGPWRSTFDSCPWEQ